VSFPVSGMEDFPVDGAVILREKFGLGGHGLRAPLSVSLYFVNDKKNGSGKDSSFYTNSLPAAVA